jgi:zinc/manganese transport system substrate-binding protein
MYSGLKGRRAGAAIAVLVLLVVAASVGIYFTQRDSGTTTNTNGGSSNSAIQIVAAENFWGNLASQLGGSHVNVTSIVTDPNADPHDYQASSADARAVSDAKLVIVNGAGYDTWANTLIAASSTPNQKVLNVQQLTDQPVDANPHLWYSPYFVNDTVRAIYNDLVAMDPTDSNYFHQQYAALNNSLWQGYMSLEFQIRQSYGGTPVGATEDIFAYMANATGLNLVSPAGFMQAVAEGTDPSAQDVATFQQLLQGGRTSVSVLVYNQQTVTPLTDNIKALAAQNNIHVTPVTETMPLDTTFQGWMGSELTSLQNALKS